MNPKAVSVTLLAAWLLSSVALRIGLHWRSTGSSGVARLSARPGSVEWFGGALFVVALIAAAVGVCVADEQSWSTRGVSGIVFAAVGAVGTFVSQTSMGSSWRIGVDCSERTELRTEGLYGFVRNPIFTAMTLTLLGFAIVTTHWLVVASTVIFLVAIELQVRFVEEPYLASVHRVEFLKYATRVGRFLPKVGRGLSRASVRR